MEFTITPNTKMQNCPAHVEIETKLAEGQDENIKHKAIVDAIFQHAASLRPAQHKPTNITIYDGHINSDNVTHINLTGTAAAGIGKFSVKIRPNGQSEDDPYFFHLKAVVELHSLSMV